MKLAGCALLDRFLSALDHPEVRIAATTRFSLPKQAQKKIKDQARVEALCGWLKDLQETKPVEDMDLLDRLSEHQGIDSGEGQLIGSFCESPEQAQLITGDRRALRTVLGNQQRLQDVYNRLAGNVHTLESAVLLLLEQYGFAEIDETMRARAIDDAVLNMAFGAGRNLDHARQCLSSNTREVLPLLAHPELIIPDQALIVD